MLDIALILMALPLLLPVGLLVSAMVCIKLGRPVLFRQQRSGLHGMPFEMLKFRSMTDACGQDGVLLPDAQRLAAFGRWLRSTSLDELPELINVMRGDMSLVGPRPLLMQYLPRYNAEQARRHQVRPGLTGFAQVRGRNAIGWDERLALDVWYVDHRSLWLDLQILAQTVSTVLMRRGISAAGEATMSEFMGPSFSVKKTSPAAADNDHASRNITEQTSNAKASKDVPCER